MSRRRTAEFWRDQETRPQYRSLGADLGSRMDLAGDLWRRLPSSEQDLSSLLQVLSQIS